MVSLDDVHLAPQSTDPLLLLAYDVHKGVVESRRLACDETFVSTLGAFHHKAFAALITTVMHTGS